MPPSRQPPSFSLFPCLKNRDLIFHQTLILIITFLAYASLHASRKPPSIVKSVLGPDIPKNGSDPLHNLSRYQMGWAPFNGTQGTHRLGELDLAFLSSYALGMFFSGHFADTADLRLFLSSGMLLSGVFTVAFGFGYWFRIHSLLYFVMVQVFCGLFQSTGWPSVVAIVGNWFGNSSKKGLIMGIWNSHTSVGNILGAVIASSMIKHGWGWSFFWPGLFVFVIGLVVYFFLVVSPQVDGFRLITEIELNASVKDIPVDVPGNAEAEESSLLDSDYPDSLKVPQGVALTDVITSDAIGFMAAWRLPGVASFAICLFFSKLVAYTFLYWLPFYIRHTGNALGFGKSAYFSLRYLFSCGFPVYYDDE